MRFNRVIVTAAILALGLGLSACETSDLSDKIQDKLNDMNLFGTAKKPLTGERREVFPGGAVPGVTQGVPPSLMPGGAEANAAPPPPPPPVAPPPPVKKKKKRVAAKKRNPPPPGATPPADGVWPAPPNPNPPPPPNSVWPPPPK
jgi:hypothetical protein